MVQRRAARFVKSRYKRTDSVTAMLDELGWPILSKRRKDARLILFYKIINNLAQVPHEHILTKVYEGTTSNIGVSLISLHDTPRPHTLKRVIRNLMRLVHI